MSEINNGQKSTLHFFKMINNEIIFGEAFGVQTAHGEEIQIRKPYTMKREHLIPYMSDVMGSAPGAIQIHPMNVLWSVPLEEFPEVYNAFKKATSLIEVSDKKIIT